MNAVTHADVLRDRLADQLTELANERIETWRKAFTAKFPRQRGRITFGMGSEYVEIGGRQVNSWEAERYRVLRPLFAAIDDVVAITDQYRDACPDDVTI